MKYLKKGKEQKRCWYCGKLTYYYGLDDYTPFCSDKCFDLYMKDWVKMLKEKNG